MKTDFAVSTKRRKTLTKRVAAVLLIVALILLNLNISAFAAITTGDSKTASSGGAYTVTIAKPAGTVAGDVLVACIVASSANALAPAVEPEPPDSSWQVIRTTNANQTWLYAMVTYYKIAGANEPASYTWKSTYINTSGGITRLTGIDINRVVDVSADNQGQGVDTLVTAIAPSVTTSYANDVVINFFGSFAALADPWFVEGTYTPALSPLYEWAPAYPGSGAYDPPSIAAYSWTKTSAGSTGDRNCRLGKRAGSGGVSWVAQTVAFKAAPTVEFQSTSTSQVEGSTQQVNLTLSSASAGPVTVYYSLSGTATPTTDYTVTASPYVIPAGQTAATLSITSLPDSLYEHDETVILTITSASGAITGGNTTHTHTITNNDFPAPTPVISVGASSTTVSPVASTPPPSELQVLQIPNPGSVAGDFLLAAITRQGSSWSQTITPPAGWILIRETYYANSQGMKLATYYKIAGASEPTNYTWGIPYDGSMSGFHASGGITRYKGVDMAQPIDVSSSTTGTMPSGTVSGTVNVPSVYPSYANDRIVSVIGIFGPVNGITAPAGMTERYEITHSISPYNSLDLQWPTTQMSDMTWAPATATGAKTASVLRFITNENTDWVAQTIALKAVPQINFYPVSSSGSESATTVNLPVYLSSPKNGTVTVNYAVNAAGTTAKSGADYNLASGTLTFAAGETSKNIVLSVINDTEYENNETIQVTISSPTGAILGANTSYTYTINDNDANPADAIVYQNTNNSGGIGGFDNHLLGIGKPAGTTTGDFLLACIVNRTDSTAVGVTAPEGWTLIGNTLGDLTRVTTFYRFAGTSPGTDPDTYGFTIGTAYYAHEDHATGSIVRYTGVDPSNPVDLWAGAGAMNSTAIAPSLHPSFDNGRLVTVFGSYVPVDFSTPAGMNLLNYVHYHTGEQWPSEVWPATYVFDQAWDPASLTGTRTSTLATFGIHVPRWTAQSLVLHDAQPGIVVNPTAGLITTEAGGKAQFTVKLSSKPTANVTIGLSSSDLTEGTVSPASLTFTPTNWIVPQTVTITGVDDSVCDGPIAYTIVTAPATSTDSNYNGRNAADVSVTNTDNDTSGITANATSGLVTTEAGGQASFTLILTSQPTANVTIALASSDTTEGTVSPTSLAFTSSNWNTAQTVTVTGVNDSVDDGDIPYTINATASSSDANYNGKSASVGVTNSDNDITVSFNANGGSPTPANQVIATGGKVTKPTDPTKSEYTFDGWYTDNSTFLNKWDFNTSTVGTSSFTLFARWSASMALPAWSIDDVSQLEGDGGIAFMKFTVSLSSASTSSVSVQYATADGTATAGSDYGSASGTLNMGPGVDSGTIWIEIIGDTLYEQDETFFINLSNPVGSTISRATGQGTILNDDAEGTAPVISANPVDRSIVYGADTTFTATATGTPAPTVKWQVSTNGGSSFSDLSNGGVYSGATTGTLSLTRPPVAYSGYKYRAVFTNGISPDATSTVATLTVAPLGITGNFTAGNKVYDGNADATVSGRTLNGVLSADVVSLTGGTAAFGDKNAGTSKTVTLTGATLSGTDAANYSLSSVANTTAAITPRPVDPTIVANDKPYDGTTTATLSNQTVSGVISPDVVTLVVGAANFADKNVGIGKTVTATTLSLGEADAGNYSLSASTATDDAQIFPLNLTISGAAANDKVYDGIITATVDFTGASLAGAILGDDIGFDIGGYSATFENKMVGVDKPVSVAGVVLNGTDAGNYSLSQPKSLVADIAVLEVIGKFTADSKTYDGNTTATVSERIVKGAIMSDDIHLIDGTAAFADKNAGTGKVVTLTGATLSGMDVKNYSLTSVSTSTADIKANPIAPAIVANNKVYDGTTVATLSSRTLDGVISTDDVTLLVGAANFSSKSVGTWTVTASGLSLGGGDAGNYSLSAATSTDEANITAFGLTITGAVAQDKVYDGDSDATVDFTGASLAGAILGDDIGFDTGGYSATFADKNVGDAKSVTVLGVTLSGADAANYTLSQPEGLTADITALGITGSFTADNKVYDGTTPAYVLTRSLNGVLGADGVELTGGTAAFSDKHVDDGKIVTLTGATLSGTDAGNYKLTSVADTTATITPKLVNPAIAANDKPYDGTTTATLSSQTVSGVISPDVVTLVVGVADFADKNVGTWTVTASGLSLGGTDAGNYSLSSATATSTANITPIGLTITGASAQSKVYDGSTAATINFADASLVGVVGNDDVNIDTTGYTATFADKNVGIDKPVTVLGVELSGTNAGNYTLSQPEGLTANITALGITGNFTAANKVYDGTNDALVLTRSLNGVLGADGVELTGGTAAFSDKHVDDGKIVTLTGATLSGTDAGNYKLTSVATTTANITVRAIEVTAVTDTKIYDGTTRSDEPPTAGAPGLATGDTADWTQTFDTKDVGINKTLTPAGTVTDGNGGANYSVTFVPVNTGVIEKATLIVTADSLSSQYSDHRLPLTSTVAGFVPGETLQTSGVNGSPDYTTEVTDPITQTPGVYAITPTLGSLKANNYDFTFADGTYTVTIEDATLSFSSTNPVSVKVAADGGNNAAFTWLVTITDNDGSHDYSKINATDFTLAFTAVGSGGGWTGPASSFDPGTGIATFNIPENALGVETYSGKVSLDNAYFDATEAEDVLVVYDPSLGFTTGGGWFYWPAGTSNPELEGAKTNFGFTMKYNRKGTSVQGSFLLIAHLPDGSIIRMKSNAVYGLAIISKDYPGIASFSGKCVYSRIDAEGNVVAEAGNQEFTVYVKDMNEPGTGVDMFWFTTKLTIVGEKVFSLDSNANNKADEAECVPLGGGNIIVPHNAASSGDTGGDTPPGPVKKK